MFHLNATLLILPLFRFRVHDVSRSGFNDWPFMTVHQWGEAPHGVWELEIHNKGRYMGKWIIQKTIYSV